MHPTALLVGLLALPPLTAQQPAMFRGNAAHTGLSDSAKAPTLTRVKWRVQLGPRVLSSPVAAEGLIFLGSADHHLYALDPATGATRWRLATQGEVNSTPAAAEGLVVVGSRDGTVRGVEARTGKAVWTFRTGGERRFTAPGIHGAVPATEVMPDPFDVFLSSPVIAEGVVYIGSGDQHVYALDLKTGALRWKFRTGDVVHASPAVVGGLVYIGSWDRTFYALEATTGTPRWTFQTGDDPELHNQVGIASSAAVAEGRVFFGCRDGHFYALDAQSGALLWKHDNHKGWVIASPAVAKGRVYFPTSDGRRFKALDAATGALRFDRENPAISFSSPTLAAGRLYFGSSDGWLRAVDAATGAEVGGFQSEGNRLNGPKYLDAQGHFRGDALYPSRTLEGLFLGMDRMFSLGAILSSPLVLDGVCIAACADGAVYALE